MATQEEILEAIIEAGGVITFTKLKEKFNLPKTGSSWLPQRLRSLKSKKLIFILKLGKTTIILAHPDLLDFDFRGRPRGFSINSIMEQKLLSFVNERKIVSWRQLRDGLRWDTRTLNKYINALLRKNMLIEWDTGTLLLYMTPQSLDRILNEYYNKLYENF